MGCLLNIANMVTGQLDPSKCAGKINIMDRYQKVGLGLAIFGAILALYSQLFLAIIPFTAFGLASIILGVAITMVPDSPISSQIVTTMVEASCAQVEAVLEDIRAKERAAYLPTKDGKVVAFIPFKPSDYSSTWEAKEKILGLVVTIRGAPSLIIRPPGSEIVRQAGLERGGDESDVDKALSNVLVDFLEAADSVKTISEGNTILVMINKPRIKTDYPLFNHVLGSFVTSLSGCIVAHVLDKPMKLVDEQVTDTFVKATFEVPPGSG